MISAEPLKSFIYLLRFGFRQTDFPEELLHYSRAFLFKEAAPDFDFVEHPRERGYFEGRAYGAASGIVHSENHPVNP